MVVRPILVLSIGNIMVINNFGAIKLVGRTSVRFGNLDDGLTRRGGRPTGIPL